jgi:hypothetical protein
VEADGYMTPDLRYSTADVFLLGALFFFEPGRFEDMVAHSYLEADLKKGELTQKVTPETTKKTRQGTRWGRRLVEGEGHKRGRLGVSGQDGRDAHDAREGGVLLEEKNTGNCRQQCNVLSSGAVHLTDTLTTL